MMDSKNGPRDTHGFGDVGAYVFGSKRKCPARSTIGSVPGNRGGVGDLRPALREIEIAVALNKQHTKSIERVAPEIAQRLQITGGTVPSARDYGVILVVSVLGIYRQSTLREMNSLLGVLFLVLSIPSCCRRPLNFKHVLSPVSNLLAGMIEVFTNGLLVFG